MPEMKPPKHVILPSAGLCVGGPLDGQLQVIPDDGRGLCVIERTPDLTGYWQEECSPAHKPSCRRIEYRRQTFATESRDWVLFIDERMTTDEAFSALVMSYALRKSGDDALQKIEAVR